MTAPQRALPCDPAGPTPERVRSLLAERARILAQPIAAPGSATAALDVLCLAIAGERYGLETRHVREIVPLDAVTPVPGTPDFVAGVVNIHGEIVVAIALDRFFAVAGAAAHSRIVVCGTRDAELAILADAVDSVRSLALCELREPPRGGRLHSPVRGVTADALVVLDGAALLAEPRFLIDQPGG